MSQYFYDGQIRRYVTQFMRVFIGFKVKSGDGTLKQIPVMYGDMSRQVASIIKENSENKMPTVPRIACYITGIELARDRLSDATFVSKLNIRERAYDEFYPQDYFDVSLRGKPIYKNTQGGGYTVERLMPTPYKLTMKADIWTSNTDQKLQVLEQILMLFNPSLEIQTTDNYIDWASLSVIDLSSTTFTSRSIPQGTENDIDICSLDFEMPIYISPPTKVKKLGVVKNIIMNIFGDQGDVNDLSDILFNNPDSSQNSTPGEFGVILLNAGIPGQDDFTVELLDVNEAVLSAGLEAPAKGGPRITWYQVLEQYGKYQGGISKIYFMQPSGLEIGGTFVINDIDPTKLMATITDYPSNSIIDGTAGYISAVIDPYKFNPLAVFGSKANIPNGTRYLLLDELNILEDTYWTTETRIVNNATTQFDTAVPYVDLTAYQVYVNKVLVKSSVVDTNGSARFIIDPVSSGTVVIRTMTNYDGPDAWKNTDMTDTVAPSNSIIEWNANKGKWETVFLPSTGNTSVYITNEKTGIQYKWDGEQWLKSFEGEYAAGYWRFVLDPL